MAPRTANGRSDVFEVTLDYLIATILVLSTAAIWTVADGSPMTFDVLRYAYDVVLFIGVLICAARNINVKHQKGSYAELIVLSVLFVAYIAISRTNMIGYLKFFLVPMFLGMAYCLVRRNSLGVISCLADIVTILAASSLVLYVLGPLLGIIQPTGSVSFTWAYPRSCSHYFYLLYCSQQVAFEGFSLVRNCGIFAEAPMFNILLCLALAYEVFIRDKSRIYRIAIIVATIITTISTTGMLVVLLVVLFKYSVHMSKIEGITLGKLVLPLLLTGVFVGSVCLLDFKLSYSMGSDSMSIRGDHMAACFEVFARHPFFGVGFNQEDAVLGYSAYQQGMSVGLPYLMATGGLALSLLWIIPQIRVLILCAKSRNYDGLAFTLVVFALYFLTAVTFRPLMEYLMAFFLMWKIDDSTEGISLKARSRDACGFGDANAIA